MYNGNKVSAKRNIIGLLLFKASKFLNKLSYKIKSTEATNIKYHEDSNNNHYILYEIDGEKHKYDIKSFINKGLFVHLTNIDKDEFIFKLEESLKPVKKLEFSINAGQIEVIENKEVIIGPISAQELLKKRNLISYIDDKTYDEILNLISNRRKIYTSEKVEY